MQDREGRTEFSLQGIILSLLFGGLIALTLCFLFLLIFSIMLVTGMIPEESMSTLCIILCGISSLVGGHFAIKRSDGPPLIVGLMTAAFLCILILIIGFCGYPNASLEGTSLWILLSALLGGGVAGLIKPNKKKKKRKKK